MKHLFRSAYGLGGNSVVPLVHYEAPTDSVETVSSNEIPQELRIFSTEDINAVLASNQWIQAGSSGADVEALVRMVSQQNEYIRSGSESKQLIDGNGRLTDTGAWYLGERFKPWLKKVSGKNFDRDNDFGKTSRGYLLSYIKGEGTRVATRQDLDQTRSQVRGSQVPDTRYAPETLDEMQRNGQRPAAAVERSADVVASMNGRWRGRVTGDGVVLRNADGSAQNTRLNSTSLVTITNDVQQINGMLYRRVETGRGDGWVADQYLVASNKTVETRTYVGGEMHKGDMIEVIHTYRGSTSADVASAAATYRKELAESEFLREFEEKMNRAMQKANDGRLIEGGLFGLVQSVFDMADGKDYHREGIEKIAKAYGMDTAQFRQKWGQMIDAYRQRDELLSRAEAEARAGKKGSALGQIMKELNLEGKEPDYFLEDSNKFFRQNRRFLGRDLFITATSALMGSPTIVIGHLKLPFIKNAEVGPDINIQSQIFFGTIATEQHEQRLMAADRLSGVTLDAMSAYQAALRTGPSTPSTVRHSQEMSNIVAALQPVLSDLGVSIDSQGRMYRIAGRTAKALAYDGLEHIFEMFEKGRLGAAIRKATSENANDAERIKATQTAIQILTEEFNSDLAKLAAKKGRHVDAMTGRAVQYINLPFPLDKRVTGSTKSGKQDVKAVWTGKLWAYYVNGHQMSAEQIAQKSTQMAGLLNRGKTDPSAYNKTMAYLRLAKPSADQATAHPEQMSERWVQRTAQLRMFQRLNTLLANSLETRQTVRASIEVAQQKDPYLTAVHAVLAKYRGFDDFMNSDLGASVSPSLEKKLEDYYNGKGRRVQGKSVSALSVLTADSEFRSWVRDFKSYVDGHRGPLQQRAQAAAAERRPQHDRRVGGHQIGSLTNRSAYGENIGNIQDAYTLQTYIANAVRPDGSRLMDTILGQLGNVGGVHIDEGRFLQSLAGAQKIFARGLNTGTNTQRGGGSSYSGDMWVMTVPREYVYYGVDKRTTVKDDITIGIKPDCSNLVLLERKQQHETGYDVPADNAYEISRRLALTWTPKKGGSDNPKTDKPKDPTIDKPPTGECFVAGTQVTMGDGSTKNIEDVAVGDMVLTYNENTGEQEVQKVLKTNDPVHKGVYTVNDGLVEMTETHPLRVTKPDGAVVWASPSPQASKELHHIDVEQLEVGDLLHYINGESIEITSLEYVEGDVQTYNLTEVENNHTFYANGILAHNKTPPVTTPIKQDAITAPGNTNFYSPEVTGGAIKATAPVPNPVTGVTPGITIPATNPGGAVGGAVNVWVP